MLDELLSQRRIPARISIRRIPVEDLDDFMHHVAAERSVNGLIVTTPHKRAIVSHLNWVVGTARITGSANTVKRLRTGALVGAQFDGDGVVNALTAAAPGFEDSRILLAGLGGAGLAIAHALQEQQCKQLCIADSDHGRVALTLETLRRDGGFDVMECRHPAPGDAEVLINATPLGMQAGDPSPFEEDVVSQAEVVADIVSDPHRTRLAGLARHAGVKLVSGRDVVRGQLEPIADWLLREE